MPRPCSICSHAKHAAINRMLRLEESTAEIARRYQVSPDAVQRHRQHRVSRKDIAEDSRNNAPGGAFQSHQDTASAPVPERAYYDHVISYPDYEVSVTPETSVDVLKQGLPYIRRAVRLAGENRLEQERLVAILNEALQSESMGLE